MDKVTLFEFKEWFFQAQSKDWLVGYALGSFSVDWESLASKLKVELV
jgi:hypothetical protein